VKINWVQIAETTANPAHLQANQ